MDKRQMADRIATLAWEVQPDFKHRFSTVGELAARILAGYNHGNSSSIFLPVSILETLCMVDAVQNTVAHAELDEVLGEQTIDPETLAQAQAFLAEVSPAMPAFKKTCGDWIYGDDNSASL